MAREYGLPAVTNVGTASRVIRTGDLVAVDGNQGRVIILKRSVNPREPTKTEARNSRAPT